MVPGLVLAYKTDFPAVVVRNVTCKCSLWALVQYRLYLGINDRDQFRWSAHVLQFLLHLLPDDIKRLSLICHHLAIDVQLSLWSLCFTDSPDSVVQPTWQWLLGVWTPNNHGADMECYDTWFKELLLITSGPRRLLAIILRLLFRDSLWGWHGIWRLNRTDLIRTAFPPEGRVWWLQRIFHLELSLKVQDCLCTSVVYIMPPSYC